MNSYKGERFNVEFYPSFLSEAEATILYNHIESSAKWSSKITPGKRVNANYGDPGVSYQLKIRDAIIDRKVLPWKELPILELVRDRLINLSKSKYNYCVVQRYPSGNVGIKAHRDKEMKSGTDIAGVSLGSKRTLILYPPNYNGVNTMAVKLELPPGSLYILKPPTNDHWTHSIEKDGTVTAPRISLTFRYT